MLPFGGLRVPIFSAGMRLHSTYLHLTHRRQMRESSRNAFSSALQRTTCRLLTCQLHIVGANLPHLCLSCGGISEIIALHSLCKEPLHQISAGSGSQPQAAWCLWLVSTEWSPAVSSALQHQSQFCLGHLCLALAIRPLVQSLGICSLFLPLPPFPLLPAAHACDCISLAFSIWNYLFC